MQPLRIDVNAYGTLDSNGGNIQSALMRSLPEINPGLCAHDGHLIIAASGPSLPDFIEAIRTEKANGRPVCAVNGAYDYLVEQQITPDLFLTCDPRPMPQNVKNPQDDTIFLLASRANPELFDRLANHKVIIWHSFGNEAEAEFTRGHMVIGGGSTSGLRAITVGYVLGFRNFVLYGMDSCLAADRLTKRFTGEKAGQVVDVIVGDRTFYCNGAMAQQANEVQQLMATWPDAHFEFKGDGLLAAIWAERARLGYPT
jgi:uncharacterized Rossmann fold enzyme